ncbi:hypothetical protein [Serratia aquatilis]|uniref:Uncharacterized protein n=1 Tax=Serratia aquatilis TaxID=1737515 RepID=A0ABV6EJG4_9GAMM
MTIYTEKPIARADQSICFIPPSIGEALSAAASSGWYDSALVSYFRNSKLDYISINSNSVLVEKSIADEVFNNYGVNYVIVPDVGIKKDVFNKILDFRIEQINSEQILCGVEKGSYTDYAVSFVKFTSSPVFIFFALVVASLLVRKYRSKKEN